MSEIWESMKEWFGGLSRLQQMFVGSLAVLALLMVGYWLIGWIF